MQMIRRFIESIHEELEDARMYAELYLEYNNTRPSWSRMFHEMSEQELNHAGYLKKMCEEFSSDLKWISHEDKEAWEKCVEHYSECVGITKAMLSV